MQGSQTCSWRNPVCIGPIPRHQRRARTVHTVGSHSAGVPPPGPERSSRAIRRPAIAMTSASSEPVATCPSPTDHSASVAWSRSPAIFFLTPKGEAVPPSQAPCSSSLPRRDAPPRGASSTARPRRDGEDSGTSRPRRGHASVGREPGRHHRRRRRDMDHLSTRRRELLRPVRRGEHRFPLRVSSCSDRSDPRRARPRLPDGRRREQNAEWDRRVSETGGGRPCRDFTTVRSFPTWRSQHSNRVRQPSGTSSPGRGRSPDDLSRAGLVSAARVARRARVRAPRSRVRAFVYRGLDAPRQGLRRAPGTRPRPAVTRRRRFVEAGSLALWRSHRPRAARSGRVVPSRRWAPDKLGREDVQARDGEFVDMRSPAGQARLEVAICALLEAASMARVEVPRDALCRYVVGLAVEVCLQRLGDRPALGHCRKSGHRCHHIFRRGATPVVASRSRSRFRARWTRLITVPSGTPSSRAASA
jgi:hypothetical protein